MTGGSVIERGKGKYINSTLASNDADDGAVIVAWRDVMRHLGGAEEMDKDQRYAGLSLIALNLQPHSKLLGTNC